MLNTLNTYFLVSQELMSYLVSKKVQKINLILHSFSSWNFHSALTRLFSEQSTHEGGILFLSKQSKLKLGLGLHDFNHLFSLHVLFSKWSTQATGFFYLEKQTL